MRPTVRARLIRLVGAGALAGSLLLPAAGPAAAADPVVLRVGTTQDFDASNPYQTALVSGLRGLPADLQPAGRLRPEPRAGPGLRRFLGACPRQGHVPHPDRDEVVRRPAGDLGRRLLQLAAGGRRHRRRLQHRARLPRPEPQGRRRHQGRVPGRPDDDRLHDRPVRPDLPGLPADHPEAHLGQRTTTRPSPTRSSTRRSSGRGRTRWPSGRPASSCASCGTPTTGARRGSRTRSSSRSSAARTRWSRRSSRATSTTPTLVNADQLKALQNEPDIKTVVGSANGWTQLAFNEYGAGTGKTIKGGGPSTKALLDPAFRDALGYAVDHQALVDRVLGGFGDLGNTIVPPVLGQWHVEPDHPRTFDIELAKQKLDAAGYKLDSSGNRLDKEGKPITLRLYMPDSSEDYPKAAAVHQGLVRPARRQGPDQGPRQRDADRPAPAAGGRRQRQPGQVRHRAVGLVGQPGPECPAPDLPLRRDRQHVRQQLLQPRLRQALRPGIEAVGRRPQGDPGPDAEPDLRPGRLRHPVLRRQPRCLPHGSVRRLAEHAQQRDPAVHLRHPRLHEADRRQGRGQRPAERRAGGVRAARPARPGRRRRRRPAPSPTSSSGDNTALIVVVVLVIVVVIGGWFVMSRRRAGASAEDE